MSCRCLIVVFVLSALATARAARPGSQALAALTPTLTWGQECVFTGTISDEVLEKSGVKRSQGMCFCGWGQFPSKECGGTVQEVKARRGGWIFRAFDLAKAGPPCRCLEGFDKARERSKLVAAAAVRFCAAIVEGMAAASESKPYLKQSDVRDDLNVTPELCQEILTGTLDDFKASRRSKELFGEANGLSKHSGTKGWGHLDPLVAGGLPSSAEYHIKLLHHVCHDECQEMVNETVKNIREMTGDFRWRAMPSEQVCADNVVRKVEAEILGCCGRSCGWDGRSCRSWPFLGKTEKEDWLGQCCSEYNVLQNSTRERMCDSVLSPKEIRLVSQFDTKAKGDVGAAYIGQDPQLLWAEPGLVKFQKQLKKLKQPPKENEPVSSDFFEKNPDVRKKGIHKGWFREEKDPEQSTSLAQLGETTCDESLQIMKKNHQHCTEQTWRNVQNACSQEKRWQISDRPDLDDDDDIDAPDASQCPLKMINPDFNTPQEVATPEECRTMDFGPGIKSRFFIYNNSDPTGELVLEKPILCFHENPCPDVNRENLNEVDHVRFKGFTKYIYWTEGA